MSSPSNWQPYKLDKIAQDLVLKYRDEEGVLNEAHKMRTTVAFGLERFWGEHLRLLGKKETADKIKGKYWQDVWKELVEIFKDKEINLPQDVWVNLVKEVLTDMNIQIPNKQVDLETINLEKLIKHEKRRTEFNEQMTVKFRAIAKQFWDQDEFPLEDQRICLSILTQLCDSLVWWTQRYKGKLN